jgi:hypothetical protein
MSRSPRSGSRLGSGAADGLLVPLATTVCAGPSICARKLWCRPLRLGWRIHRPRQSNRPKVLSSISFHMASSKADGSLLVKVMMLMVVSVLNSEYRALDLSLLRELPRVLYLRINPLCSRARCRPPP